MIKDKEDRHLRRHDVIHDLTAINKLNNRFCDFSVRYGRRLFAGGGLTYIDHKHPLGSILFNGASVKVGMRNVYRNMSLDLRVMDKDAVFASMVGCHEARHLWCLSVGFMRSGSSADEWIKDIARDYALSLCFPSYKRNIYLINAGELSSDLASIQGVRALYDARKRIYPRYADVDLDKIVSDKAQQRHGITWPQFMDCKTVKDVEAVYAGALATCAGRRHFDFSFLHTDCSDDRRMQKLLEDDDIVTKLAGTYDGFYQTDILCKYVGEHYPEYFRGAVCIQDDYFFPNEKNERELKIREFLHVRPLYDDVPLVPPTYITEDFVEPKDMALFKESLEMVQPYRPVLIVPQLVLSSKQVKPEPPRSVRNIVMPDIDRYVMEHGNGVTDAGITRSLRLLPVLRAIGDPAGGLRLTQQDIADVHVFLNDHKDHGELRFSDYGHTLRIDVKATTDAGREALDRLSAQCLPDGTTKALAAGQAVVLAMTPSEDMAHKSFWDLLGSMAGTQDMAGFTNSDVAAATVQTILTMPPGRHVREETDKLSNNWKDLMRRAPSTVMSGNPSLYMMQFVMLRNIAALDGYDLSPDEQQGSQIGELLRKKPLDTGTLRDVLSDCVTPQAETAATEIGLDKTVKPDESTPVNPILRTSGKPSDQRSGLDGPDF